MKFLKLVFAFLFLTICFSECKKYSEDSNAVHFSTSKERLAGNCLAKNKTWNVSTSAYNFVLNTLVPTSASANINFSRDGNFRGYDSPYIVFNGTWEFIDKKNKLKITDGNGVSHVFNVKKLDNDALWFQNDSIIFKYKKHVNR